MNSANQRARDIFATASEMFDAGERSEFLEQACAGDDELRREVESLLSALDQAGTFLESSALAGARKPPAPAKPTPSLDDYELLEEIARGGMGVVYKARQVSLNRQVAVKMILTGKLASESEVRRFYSEAEAAGSLDHPNIVSIFEVGQQDGCHFYSMPLVEGRSLTQLVESGQWQPADGKEAGQLLAKLARAVGHAHQQGILHRDLKPGNILIDRDREPRVLDFGLAKRVGGDSSLTVSGEVLGTPSFMAPELAAGKAKVSTAAADIYSLGAILYYLLTGRPAFVAESPLDALLLVLEGEAVMPRSLNPLVAPDLECICLHCLAKSPEHRYPSAMDLADDLERFLHGEPLTFRSSGVSARLHSWAKRQPALVSRLGGVGVVAIISETAYQLSSFFSLGPHSSREQHLQVMGVLGLWAVISCLCQWALSNERRAETVRFIWAGLDATLLTALLLIDQALQSPLIAMYPVYVAASGLWLRVRLVVLTTVMAVVGYGCLIFDAMHRQADLLWPPHWHIIVLAMVILTGFIVSYLVHRVHVLRPMVARPIPR